MASVKASFLAGITALAVIAYFGWVFVSHGLSDYTGYRGSVYASKSDSFSASNTPEVLIFGGSAGVYGISAAAIEDTAGKEAFNFALPGGGGFSFDAYQRWILEQTNPAQRAGVDVVVWYPIQLLGGNKDYFETASVDALGRTKVPWYLPRYSPLEYLMLDKSAFNPDLTEPDHGDLVFAGTDLCRDPATREFDSALPSELIEAMNSYVEFSSQEFPHATILIAVPAEWYGGAPDADDYARFVENFDTALQTVRDAHGDSVAIESLLVAPLSDADQVCNSAHHANESGREEISQQIAAAIVAVSTPGSDSASHD